MGIVINTTSLRLARSSRWCINVLAPAVALGVLLSLLGSPGPASADTSRPAAPGAAVTLERDQPPGAGDDFPRMPGVCYESDHRTVKDIPCHITRYGAKRRPTVLVWGDSHAWMYLPALRREARATRVNLILVVFGSCPPAMPLPRSRGFGRVKCEKHNAATLTYVKKLQRHRKHLSLLMGGFWAGYRDVYIRQQRADRKGEDSGLTSYQQQMSVLAVEGSPRLFSRLGKLGFDVDLIGQAATVPADAPDCPAGRDPYQCDLPRRSALIRERGNRQWIKQNLMAPLAGNPLLIDATPAYCSPMICRAHVNGENTYFDDIHLGAQLTRTMTGYFAPVFADLT